LADGNKKMKWPQILTLVFYGLNVLIAAGLHGMPRLSTYNVLLTIIGSCFWIWVLYMGGFFD